jgi:hypothetical protein
MAMRKQPLTRSVPIALPCSPAYGDCELGIQNWASYRARQQQLVVDTWQIRAQVQLTFPE